MKQFWAVDFTLIINIVMNDCICIYNNNNNNYYYYYYYALLSLSDGLIIRIDMIRYLYIYIYSILVIQISIVDIFVVYLSNILTIGHFSSPEPVKP